MISRAISAAICSADRDVGTDAISEEKNERERGVRSRLAPWAEELLVDRCILTCAVHVLSQPETYSSHVHTFLNPPDPISTRKLSKNGPD